ncbi:hypothetical protein R6Q59_032919 [Mikania micrantha]
MVGKYSDDDEDDVFYYRFSSATPQPPSSSSSDKTLTKSSSNRGGGSRLAPSKSTVYVGNLDYSLTNSDIFTIFSTFGKFVARDDAVKAVKGINGKVLNGRTLTASIAADNGRAPEFIRRKVYKDKSRCYECGEGGHLSYECPKNQLGPRERPQSSKRGRREGGGGGGGDDGYRRRKEGEWGGNDDDETGGDEVFEYDDWASVVDNGADERLLNGGDVSRDEGRKKGKKEKKTSYFSDESDKEE